MGGCLEGGVSYSGGRGGVCSHWGMSEVGVNLKEGGEWGFTKT